MVSDALGKNRQIRLFVSSTFRDMQSERNALARYCFPVARQRFARGGLGFTEIDLRWGLPVEESEDSIVEMCLREVDQCRGYFVCILGNRYGYIPDSKLLQARFKHLTGGENASITELEIRQGALASHRADLVFVQFYFKHDDTPPDNSRLDSLKEEIRTSGFPVKTYRSPEDLAKMMLADLAALAEGLGLELEESKQYVPERLLEQQHVGIPARQSVLWSMDAFLAGSEAQLLLTGPSGSGKTTVLGQWIRAKRDIPLARKRSGWRRLLSSVGKEEATPGLWLHYSTTAHADSGLGNLVTSLLAQLTVNDGCARYARGPLKDQLRVLHQMLALAALRYPLVVVVVDGLEDLFLDEVMPFHWLPPRFDHLKIILAGRKGGVESALPGDEWNRLELPPLSPVERKEAMTGYLGSYGKRLSDALLAELTEKDPLKCPLLLRLLADELRLAEDPDHLARMSSGLFEARTPEELFNQVLIRLEQEYGREVIEHICAFMACSRAGLRESELRSLIRERQSMPDMVWAGIMQRFSRSVMEQDGLFGLHHEELRQAVIARYLDRPIKETTYRSWLIDWFACETPAGFGPSMRVVHELPWQLAQMQDWDSLGNLLAEPLFFAEAWRLCAMETISYWRTLESQRPGWCARAYAGWAGADDVISSEAMAGAALLLATLGRHHEAAALASALLLQPDTGISEVSRLSNMLNMAAILLDGQKVQEAECVLDRVETLLGKDTPPLISGMFHTLRGNLWLGKTEPAEALKEYQLAQNVFAELGDEFGAHLALHNHGAAMAMTGRCSTAIKMLSECSHYFKVIHDLEAYCDTQRNLSLAFEKDGSFGKAEAALTELEQVARARHDFEHLAQALNARARLAEMHGDRDLAEAILVECQELCRQQYLVHDEVAAMMGRAAVRMNLGPRGYSSAMKLLDEAGKLAEVYGLRDEMSQIETLTSTLVPPQQ